MRILKKSFFTLIEMMIVMTIMSLAVMVTGIKLKEAYDEQRFLSESQEVLSTLALAQDLMLIQDADVEFTLAYNNELKKYECWIEVEKPLNKSWSKLVERRHQLPAIKAFEFTNHPSDPLHLTFSLGKMSHGKLILYAVKEKDKAKLTEDSIFEIVLPGYPSPLVSRSRDVNIVEIDQMNDQLYPAKIHEETDAHDN
jgi:prepilin-type N-terminal cleavage/methylation domain-containing protein